MQFRQTVTRITAGIASVLCLVLMAACAMAGSPQRTVLKVVPYPDIPGSFDSMLAIVEKGFEKKNPDIDLVLVPASVHNVYELPFLREVLTNSTEQGGAHIVETDTIMMGDLALEGIIRPQTFTSEDWHPLIVKGTTVNGVRYGVPHWLCGNFLISRDQFLTQSQGVKDLNNRIRTIKPKGPWLAGNYAGTSYLVLYYTQAWGEDRPRYNDLLPAITGSVVPSSARNVAAASNLCIEDGKNPCVDGTYYNDFTPIFERTVKGDYAALQGFSESMWYMMQYGAKPEEWHISPLPIGDTTRNVILGDAYIARKDLDPATATAAEKFYSYMMEDATYQAIIFSGGQPGQKVPRYLAPARLNIFSLPDLKNDVYYQRVFAAMTSTGGTNYPNLYVPDNRDRIYEQVMPYLNGAKTKGPRRSMMQHHMKRTNQKTK
ncbi:hypothetical protein N1030_14020 [Desulfovibrio mangrovi]|uniref:hypothetical protein n=1 Tax=Desulfovibrio mangrovi TaxID=2976983 RepID=UPI0022451D98|nr:hypothetical protein [Desulfovibrio mangrovi]UZP66717.1 hypothetical protein N1030_14020 [Desulfovibrio mangrovi]